MKKSKYVFSLAAISTFVLLGGCLKSVDSLKEKAVEKATEKATEVALEKVADETGLDVNISSGTNTATFTMEDGSSISVGESAELPKDWPSDVPFPKNITVSSAGFFDDAYSSVYGSEQTPTELADFYETKLTANGWSKDSETVLAGYYMYVYKKGDRELNINLVQSEKEAIVTISVSQ